MIDIEPYRIAVPEDVLTDLRQRLARTRFPDEMPGSAWGYGANLAAVRELVAYWQDHYDWRAAEAQLNQWNQIRVRVGGLGIHAIHQKGVGPKPLPLVITHGWPGSVSEFQKIIGPLTNPEKYGGAAADAFDVVCPSMPGYGFSDHPTEAGMDPERIAALWVELMQALGYRRFGAQGGDWGAMVTTYLGARHAPNLIGIHLNMVVAFPPNPDNPIEGVSEEELPALMEMAQFLKDETGYQQIQGTKPQTLAYALNDSPAGLAAWILEKFHGWSDCHGDVFARFSKDELLTNIMLYWASEAASSSIRLYCETMRAGKFPPTGFRVDVPTGCAIFAKEIVRAPRAWAEKLYNITQWSRFASGGHFAAMEEPQALVEDIRSFFRPLR